VGSIAVKVSKKRADVFIEGTGGGAVPARPEVANRQIIANTYATAHTKKRTGGIVWVGKFPHSCSRLCAEIRSIRNWLGNPAIIRSRWVFREWTALRAARSAT
jgi:hypothetical protein